VKNGLTGYAEAAERQSDLAPRHYRSSAAAGFPPYPDEGG
jgi:hypothetical protein